MEGKIASVPEAEPVESIVHPLVLLSIVDHYNRVAKGAKDRRVVGVLLGENFKGKIDISNSFAVPFDEDVEDPSIWYLDHNFMENMYRMFKKINAKETIVGFYSTGPKIRSNDLDLDSFFRRFVTNPVFVIVDVDPEKTGIPTESYVSIEVLGEDKVTKRTFKTIESKIEAFEAEEVGVEHLLRDINDPTISTLHSRVKHKATGLENLKSKLLEMKKYLEDVRTKKLEPNNEIIKNIQSIFNLLPSLEVDQLVRSLMIKTNDMHLVLYIASLIRSVLALHELLLNQTNYE